MELEPPTTRPRGQYMVRPSRPGLGLRLVLPVDLRVGERESVADRRLDPKARVRAAGLEDEHAIAPARRQAIGEHAARGAGADDDVVEIIHG